MSADDPSHVVPALFDLSKFKVLPDRLAQGLLNELFLARLMYHPQGFGTNAAFQNSGTSVIRTDHVYYMGASQGGIMGGPLTALSPDCTQASLLVGGMNYSMLLPRSIDFDLYAGFMYPSYPDQMARPLLFGLMQMLWDRSEPNGYAHRMTDNPLPDTPKHNVTLQIALGDHQGLAGLDHPGARNQLVAVGRVEQVHLVFDRERAGVMRHRGEAGVARSRVGQHAGDASVE